MGSCRPATKRRSSPTTTCPTRRTRTSAGWHAADLAVPNRATRQGAFVMALFLFIIIVAIALGIAGVVVKGLFYLLIIGVVLFLADLVLGGIRMGRRRGTRP